MQNITKNVFLSWSKERSKAVAQILREWLPDVIQTVKPWISTDIEAGARWSKDIAAALANLKFGIICVTQENQREPWLLFEAGALAKTLDEETYVCPYLIGMAPHELQPSPLTQFQVKQANESGTCELIDTLNGALGNPLSESQLRRSFERCWPELAKKLNAIPETDDSHKDQRSFNDILNEVLEISRYISIKLNTMDSQHLGEMQRNIINMITIRPGTKYDDILKTYARVMPLDRIINSLSDLIKRKIINIEQDESLTLNSNIQLL